MPWEDDASTPVERLARLAERYLRPMVLRAEEEDRARCERESAHGIVQPEPSFPFLSIGPRVVRPVCTGPIHGDGSYHVYADNGARYLVDAVRGYYVEGAPLPGSERARELREEQAGTREP